MMDAWQGYPCYPCPEKRWRYQVDRMQELQDPRRIRYPTNTNWEIDYSKRPRLKRHLHEQKGSIFGNVWKDIRPLSHHAKARTGYPTQKPLALLERIIKASSNEGATRRIPRARGQLFPGRATAPRSPGFGRLLLPSAAGIGRSAVGRTLHCRAGQCRRPGRFRTGVPATRMEPARACPAVHGH